jgi:hypothetical protein
MTQKNVTYLLGAGASKNAIPIVRNFGNRLRNLSDQLDASTDYKTIPNLHHFRNSLLYLARNAYEFNTIDTFAKKLFLIGDFESLRTLKATLSVFFTLEQFDWNFAHITAPRKPNIDSRYISLVSAFLQSSGEHIVLPPNVKFISWNYDLQLELALESFLARRNADAFSKTMKQFGSFPGVDKADNPTIVHLNGVAGLYTENHQQKLLIDLVKGNSYKDALAELIQVYTHIVSSPIESEDGVSFHFAWEDSSVAKLARVHTCDILTKTDVLVIIGYSFPAFNRVYDRQNLSWFINNSRLDRAVYYQVIRPNEEQLAKTFGLHPNLVKGIPTVKQFFLPFEL